MTKSVRYVACLGVFIVVCQIIGASYAQYSSYEDLSLEHSLNDDEDVSGSDENNGSSSEEENDKPKQDQNTEIRNTNGQSPVLLMPLVNSIRQKDGTFVQDPWYFYKWPGFGLVDGTYARFPWYPAEAVKNEEPKKKKGEDEEDSDEEDDEEEDDEDGPEDDHGKRKKKGKKKGRPHWHPRRPYRRPYYVRPPTKKYTPSYVPSFGFGPAVGKPTWYGVLRPKVNSRSDLDLLLDGEVVEVDDHRGRWLHPTSRYK